MYVRARGGEWKKNDENSIARCEIIISYFIFIFWIIIFWKQNILRFFDRFCIKKGREFMI